MTRDIMSQPIADASEQKKNDSVDRGKPNSLPPSYSLMELHTMGSFQTLFQAQEIDAQETSSSSSSTTSNLRKRNSSNALQLLDDVELTNPLPNTSVAQAPGAVADPLPSSPEEAETGRSIQTPVSMPAPKSEGKKSRPNSPQRNAKSGKEEEEASDSTTTKKKDSVTKTTAISTASSSNIIRHPNTLIVTQPPPLLLLPSPDSGNNMDPDEFLLQLVTALYPHVKLQVKPALELASSSSYFPTVTEEQMARYNTHVVALVRTNDVTALREYHATHGPNALDCCNRFGEGLLNMACRRGFTEIVAFLLSIDLSVRVRDDFGRTPLHDACWHPEPQLDICRWIMQKDPSLFLVADKRGYTPFQYARQSDWPVWRKFLVQHLEQIRVLGTQPEIVATFSAKAHANETLHTSRSH